MLLLLLLPLPSLPSSLAPPSACVSQGTCYQGRWANTTTSTTYASFQGVRYAQPPLGALRLPPRPNLCQVQATSAFPGW